MVAVNEHARALGRMAKGVPKNFSAQELERRRRAMVALNKRRWSKRRKK